MRLVRPLLTFGLAMMLTACTLHARIRIVGRDLPDPSPITFPGEPRPKTILVMFVFTIGGVPQDTMVRVPTILRSGKHRLSVTCPILKLMLPDGTPAGPIFVPVLEMQHLRHSKGVRPKE